MKTEKEFLQYIGQEINSAEYGEGCEFNMHQIVIDINERLANLKTNDDVAKELEVTDKLLNERQRVLDAIPECPDHGGNCVPHALEWVDKMKTNDVPSDEELKRLIWEEWEAEIKEGDPREMVFKYMKLARDFKAKDNPSKSSSLKEDKLENYIGRIKEVLEVTGQLTLNDLEYCQLLSEKTVPKMLKEDKKVDIEDMYCVDCSCNSCRALQNNTP